MYLTLHIGRQTDGQVTLETITIIKIEIHTHSKENYCVGKLPVFYGTYLLYDDILLLR